MEKAAPRGRLITVRAESQFADVFYHVCVGLNVSGMTTSIGSQYFGLCIDFMFVVGAYQGDLGG